MKALEARRAKLRWAQASASEVSATDLADCTRCRVKLRGVDDSVEEEEALAPVSSAPTTTSARRSSRIRGRSRSQRCAPLVSQGKGMFVGVVRDVKQKHFCKGMDCKFSYKNIGEKADVVGYCLWCDSDKMRKAMATSHGRAALPKKGIQFFYDNDDDVFRMALTRLPVQYRIYWPLKALGLPKQFHSEENMKAALADKNTNRYRTFIRELRAVSGRDERLYNFVCESVPSDALEDIKTQISAPTQAKQREQEFLEHVLWLTS